MKAVLVTQSSAPVYHCIKYDKRVGWVVMRIRVEIEVSMGRFTIYLMAHTAIRSPVNICVQDGKVPLQGELNIQADTVQVVKEVAQPAGTSERDDKSVIHVMDPAEEFTGCPL
jgi:hypothetical protein